MLFNLISSYNSPKNLSCTMLTRPNPKSSNCRRRIVQLFASIVMYSTRDFKLF